MAERTLRVGALYPDLLNIYADRGNLLLLERRCAWRGIGFELRGIGLGDALDPDAHDLLYIGGGQDRDQALCARDMVDTKREALHAAADRGAVIFAVCGGYQLLGHGYAIEGERLPGVGLVDLETVREDGPRLIGNVAIELIKGGSTTHQGCLGRVREPRRAHAARAGRAAARPRVARARQRRPVGLRGRARRRARHRGRHLSPRSVASQERAFRRLADRDGARRRAIRAACARRHARGRRPTRRRAGLPGSDSAGRPTGTLSVSRAPGVPL